MTSNLNFLGRILDFNGKLSIFGAKFKKKKFNFGIKI